MEGEEKDEEEELNERGNQGSFCIIDLVARQNCGWLSGIHFQNSLRPASSVTI